MGMLKQHLHLHNARVHLVNQLHQQVWLWNWIQVLFQYANNYESQRLAFQALVQIFVLFKAAT